LQLPSHLPHLFGFRIAQGIHMEKTMTPAVAEMHQDEQMVQEDEQEITKTNDPASLTVQFLQRQVANSLVLFLNYKTCSWQASGRSFGELNRFFRGLAEENKIRFDELGDRLRMIGQDPELNLESLVECSNVKQALSRVSEEHLFAAADENLIVVIRELRDQVRTLARDQDDPGTIHLLVDVLRMHERHEWNLRQVLKPSPGHNTRDEGESSRAE
jgi:DNA-binding ferritin-like protein